MGILPVLDLAGAGQRVARPTQRLHPGAIGLPMSEGGRHL
jgi:hypothetical protein